MDINKPWNSFPIDIFLLGSGIYSTCQFTVEAVQALQVCKKVLVLHDDLAILERVRSWCAEVVDMAYLFQAGSYRADVYHELSQRLIQEASHWRPIALLVHGHPLFLVSASEHTIVEAERAGYRTKVLPGISSLDTILIDLKIDLGYAVQAYDATYMVTQRIMPNPLVPLLIFQVATTCFDLIAMDDPPTERLAPLRDLLCQIYPPSHMVTFVHSATHILERAECKSIPLEKLDRSHDIELRRRPTIYVPPVPT